MHIWKKDAHLHAGRRLSSFEDVSGNEADADS